ncbi:MAG: hypothetical protein IJ721_01045 [Bacteroidales bacterium]|nr:hypothetical protein [Bacteroidales bacterium]
MDLLIAKIRKKIPSTISGHFVDGTGVGAIPSTISVKNVDGTRGGAYQL